MKKCPDVFVPRALISLQYVNLSTVLAMMYSDGIIEFRHSHSLALLLPDGEGQISSLSQIGFAFPANTLCGYLFAADSVSSELISSRPGRCFISKLVRSVLRGRKPFSNDPPDPEY